MSSKTIKHTALFIIICWIFIFNSVFPAYAINGMVGMTTVWSGSASQEADSSEEEGNLYKSDLGQMSLFSGYSEAVWDFASDWDFEDTSRNDPFDYDEDPWGDPYIDDNGNERKAVEYGRKEVSGTLSKDSYSVKWDYEDKEYFVTVYTYDTTDVTSNAGGVASKVTCYTAFWDEYSGDEKPNLEEEFGGADIDYSVKFEGLTTVGNEENKDLVICIYGHNNTSYVAEQEVVADDYNIKEAGSIQVFPDSYTDDIVYVAAKDYAKLCPWYDKYKWTNGKTNGWVGTDDEAKAINTKYGTSKYTEKTQVNNIWNSLTGKSHTFMTSNVFPSSWSRRNDSYKERYGYTYIKNADYDSYIKGTLSDLMGKTKLPIAAVKEKIVEEYTYTSKSGKDTDKTYSWYDVYIETEEQMSSTWQISSDAKNWKNVATNVKGARECYYNVLDDTLKIGSYGNIYSVSDVLPDHGKTIYVRRIANCGNVFWKGTVTSPAFRIRPFLSLDSLEVYTNKSVVEGNYLDPKDIIVIAHYNTGDTVMSGKGSYIEYPGNSNLRATIVGTNYAYYVYTDPQLGDVVKGYFQIKGIEKSPTSITAEYVGDPVVEKKEYDPSSLRVNVVFNNGSTDTFTAESSNIGTYKTKSHGRGDIDANGVLNATDLTKLKEIVSGATATATQKTQADVNKDGVINTSDITALENIISKVVEKVGTNTFYAAISGLSLSDGSPRYARFTIEGVKKSPYSVSVVQDPVKILYIEGEDFNPTEMVLKVLYDNGEYAYLAYETSNLDEQPNVSIGDDEHSAESMSAETTIMPIYYTENGVTVKTELSIKIALTTLTSIKITRAPDTVIYYSGETFKTTGMDVTAFFDEGIEGHVPDEILLTSSEYTMNGYKKMQDGTANIVFLLDDPTSMNNTSGEYLRVAIDELEDGQDLTDQNHDTFRLKSGVEFDGTVCGNYLIKVSYTSRGTTKSAYQPIYVYNKRPTALTIVSMPYVTEYVVGQEFNTSGLILRAAYSDGTSSYVYPKTETRNGYVMIDSTNLTSDRGYVIAQYTENMTTLQIEIPITVIDPNVDGITASYLGPAVYVGNQFNPKDVQIVVSYTNGDVRSFRANETNADGTYKVKIVLPVDGNVDLESEENHTLYHAGANTFAACYAGLYDLFDVNAIDNPAQLDFSGSVAKSKRMYDTWTETFTATKIRSVADYINGRVELLETENLDEYHVVNTQSTTDTRTSLTANEGTDQGINLEISNTVSPLLSFLREGSWRQPETVIQIYYKGRTKGFLYPETTNPKFTQTYGTDLKYINAHDQYYTTSRDELQDYVNEGWSDWVTNGDTVGTVLADRVAYNYTGAGGDVNSETMYLDRLKLQLDNINDGSAPKLNVTVRNSNGAETVYNDIQEDDIILDPCQIKIELAGTVNVIDNYGQTVTKPFGDVYKIFYRATTDDATGWSSVGEWAGFAGVNMQCLEIKLMLKETDFNTGSMTSAPVISRQPKNTSVKIGANATFSVSAVGNNLYYQWYCNGNAISSANEAVYTTPELTLANSGDVYYCMIIADDGTGLSTKSSSVSVTVRDTSPVLTKDLIERYDGKVGDEVNFVFAAYCLDPSSLRYEWQITQNGVYVPLAGGDEETLNLTVTADMHGEYIRCHVTNSQGACNSNPCLITCIGAPIVTIHSSEPTPYISNSKTNIITFNASVESDASGKMEYSWAFDNVTKSSATSDSTTWIPTTTGSHTITCTVTDSLGNTGTGVYTIYVGTKPSVTLSASQQKETDGSIILTVVASVTSYNTSELKYEWTYDGLSIAGNSDIIESADHKTLTILNATAGNHSISLTITDGFGSASALQAAVTQ